MSKPNWGRIMAKKRSDAADERVAKKAVSKPRTTKSNPPTLRLYPMRTHNGSVPDRPIDWSANNELSEGLAQRVQNVRLTVLVMPTGFGKTIASLQSYDAYRSLVGEDVPLTILAPPGVIKDGNWLRAIQAFNDEHPDRIIDPVMIESPRRFLNIYEHKSTKKTFLQEMGRNGIFIVDEIHEYKNPTAKQTKALSRFPHLRKIGLTGTPLTNDPVMDQISYLVLAGFHNSKTAFMEESGLDNFVDHWGQLTIYDKENNTVNGAAWPYYEVLLRDVSKIIYKPDIDISDIAMPDVTDKVHSLDRSELLDGRWRSLAKANRDGAFASQTDFLIAAMETLMIDENRLDALVKLLRQDNAHQTLVFYENHVARDAIAQRLETEGIAFSDRSGQLNTMDLSRPDPILIQYGSGGTGIEIPDSTMTVFYQNQRSYTRLIQAKGRNVRRGRTHNVEHHHLVAFNDFDYALFQNLSDRGELNEKMMIDILERSMG